MLRQLRVATCRRLSTLRPAEWACFWLACVGMVILTGGLSQRRHAAPWHPQTLAQTPAPTQLAQSRAGAFVPTEDSWGEQLRDPKFWGNRKSSGGAGGGSWFAGSAQANGLTRAAPVSLPFRDRPWWDAGRTNAPFGKSRDDDDDGDRRPAGNTYRTMCVRLCDGFYWPVSFATTKDKFDDDASSCARSCGGPETAKLFVYRNPGSDIDAMEDLNGRAYKKLENAFAFRTKYEPSCKCRPHPWEDASLERHQSYALASLARKGDVVAAQQLKDLRAKTVSVARDAKLQEAKGKRDKAAALTSEKNGAGLNAQAALAAGVAESGAAKRLTSNKQNVRVTEAPRKPNEARQLRIVTRVDDDDDDDRPQRKTVILRYGNQPPASIAVPNSRRTRRAADATSPANLRQ